MSTWTKSLWRAGILCCLLLLRVGSHDASSANPMRNHASPSIPELAGTGTYDDPYRSADGTAGIRSAMAALPPGGGQIDLPCGVFLIEEPLTLRPRAHLRGAGRCSVLLMDVSATWREAIRTTAGNRIANLCLDGQRYRQISRICGIRVSKSEDVIIDDVYFKDLAVAAIDLGGNIRHVRVTDCRFENCYYSLFWNFGNGISDVVLARNTHRGDQNVPYQLNIADNVSHVVIADNDILNYRGHFGIAVANSSNIRITGNTVIRNEDLEEQYREGYFVGIHVEGPSYNILIRDNTVRAPFGRALDISAPPTQVPRSLPRFNRVVNNHLEGRKIVEVLNSRDITIESNTFLGGGFVGRLAHRLRVEDNEFRQGSGIRVTESRDVRVRGNVVRATKAGPGLVLKQNKNQVEEGNDIQ